MWYNSICRISPSHNHAFVTNHSIYDPFVLSWSELWHLGFATALCVTLVTRTFGTLEKSYKSNCIKPCMSWMHLWHARCVRTRFGASLQQFLLGGQHKGHVRTFIFSKCVARRVFFPSGKCFICLNLFLHIAYVLRGLANLFAQHCKKTPNNRNKSIPTRYFQHCSNMESIYTMYHTATETHFWCQLHFAFYW